MDPLLLIIREASMLMVWDPSFRIPVSRNTQYYHLIWEMLFTDDIQFVNKNVSEWKKRIMDAMLYFIIYYDLALDGVYINQVLTGPFLNPNFTLIPYMTNCMSVLHSHTQVPVFFTTANSLNLNKNSNKYVLILTFKLHNWKLIIPF